MEGGPPSSCLQRGAPCHGIIGIMVNPPLDGTSNLWTKWWRLLLPIFLFNFFSLPHRGTNLHNTLFTCLRFVQLQSIFRQLDALQIDVWLKLSSHWFEYLKELPGISVWVRCFQFHACLPAAAVYPLYIGPRPLPAFKRWVFKRKVYPRKLRVIE